jgi:hypothetical protein
MYNYVSNKVPLFAGIFLTAAGWLGGNNNDGHIPDNVLQIKAGACGYLIGYNHPCPSVYLSDLSPPEPGGRTKRSFCLGVPLLSALVLYDETGPYSIKKVLRVRCPPWESSWAEWNSDENRWDIKPSGTPVNTCVSRPAIVIHGTEQCPKVVIET